MLIILEGPDCAGKSTFAQRLLTQLAVRDPGAKIELLHRGPPPPGAHPLDEYVAPLLDYWPDLSQHIICDRWHVGEAIYPAILGRKTQLTLGVLAYVKMFLRSRGACVVKLLPPWLTVTERFLTRSDWLINDISQLHRVYDAFAKSTDHDLQLEAPSVDAVIANAYDQHDAAVIRRFVTHVGATLPETLILGDVRGCLGGTYCEHNQKHSVFGPAFMPYPATSGAYLMESLTAANVDLRRIALANACDVDDVNELWWVLGCPHVVTLGVNAHRKLQTLGVPHSTAPHPQFVRRFHNKASAEYGRLIDVVSKDERRELRWRPSSADSTARASTVTPSSTY